MPPTYTLRIQPDDVTIVAAAHDALHEVLDRHGIAVTAYCDGMGICGKCVVEIRLGDGTSPQPTPADIARPGRDAVAGIAPPTQIDAARR